MINRLIDFSINNKFVIALFTVALIAGGIYSITKVPVDAVPDITNNQVQIITQAPNLGTEDIEQFVTYPIEVAVANLPEVTEIRSISRFGLSVVTIVFSDDLDTYLPRQLVAEKLNEIKSNIPEGFGKPFMGPISTGLGEIYQYTLEIAPEFKNTYDATELRTIQDWIIRRQMAMVPGVVEVNAFGGSIKQYEVTIDPNELKAIDVTIQEVYNALENNNQNTGGAYIEKNHQANFIRGEGLVRTLEDIKNIVVTNKEGIPITIKNIGTVKFGKATRYGALTKNGEGEAVGGMILMLKGASSDDVIKNVTARIVEIQKSLPEGITIKPFLDRSKLIASTTSTVKKNLLEGALIVIFILVFFLGNWRGGLVVASTIPLSLLFAFILMNIFDVWANLMSLGAIDFGIIVDGSVIIVESTVFYLYQRMKKGEQITDKTRDEVTKLASSKMMNTAFFGQFIILIVFLPILALEGVEGKMFKPMALTFGFAMIGAMVLCLTYVPMITAVFLKAPKTEKQYWGDKIVRWLENKYENSLLKALKKGKVIILSAILLLVISTVVFTRMGGEFIPQLDEGDLAFHAILKPGSSLSETISTTTTIEGIIKKNFPEVIDVISRIGVADVPTDPMPMDIADVFVILKPVSEWTNATSKEELIDKIKEKVEQIPGVNYEFTQPIEMRFNELITGVREDIAVKLYGDDLDVLAQKAEEMGKIIATVEGVADMKVEATAGQPQITIVYDRNKIAQYGLQINELNNLIETAFAGGVAGTIFEGEKRFDLVVRLKEELRKDLNSVKNVFITLPSGAQIPLKEVATINYKPGPMQISRDNTNRRIYVGINVRGRDIKSLVEEIQQKIEANVSLPSGYYIRYGGAFENLERATSKLKMVVPIALGLIFILIFFALKSFKQTIMIYMAIPLAIIGGIFSLMLRDMPFSISAGVGFIVLFGVAVLNGLVLISGFNELKEEGVTDINDRIRIGTRRRIRPILLTALTDMLGFLPMALSSSSGAEVQRPLATVVIGGLLTATLLTLFVIPILYKWIETKEQQKMKRIKSSPVAIFVLMLFCFGITTAQQPSISMADAVAVALQNYPAIESARLSVEKEKTLKTTAWDFGNTKVFTSGEEIGNNSNDATYTTIGIGQNEIDVFGIASKSKLAKENIKLAETNVEITVSEVKRSVQSAWIKAYTAKQMYASYAEIETVFADLNKAIDLRFETEAISKLEYNATANQGKLITLQKQQAYTSYQIALQKLNQWLFSEKFYDITAMPIDRLNTDVLVIETTLTNHPLLVYWRTQQAVVKAQYNVANKQFLPKLFAQYGFQTIGDQSGFNSYQIGVQIPLVFNKTKAKAKALKINAQIVEQENKIKETELKRRFSILITQFEQLQKSWLYYKDEALPLAVEQRNGATLSYKEGAMDYIAFLQNMKDAIQLEINTWNVLQQYLDSKIQLEYFLTSKQ
ncbi:CusA/CzcA family heavy metal efflux RND transporter [Aquimarina muelleri]|uniref:Acriflavine resistance protein B n=1 Tax=Aquimarina muelleri TaxID=279356 RepID=A0A918JX19_9FLAO|nr:CusA/CzcA family heavy metal efflux RND transporter [Aquimarina muelleri]MCX2764109.1 CusA/CzcA family heavy metal efflux RND transporter [Aquimarina muelleri]GGX22653.1 acriflavine resistance protein B [Aquimarina muelleri]